MRETKPLEKSPRKLPSKSPGKPRFGGGFHALKYTVKVAQRVGYLKLWRAMTSRNACKTCALGMGGQQGGMRNERGHFPEVCKKSLQAMAADMQGQLKTEFFARYDVTALQSMTPRELETAGRLVKPLLLTAGSKHYREISWEDAYDLVVSKLKTTIPEQSFFYFSGRSSNEAGFLLQLFARLYGSNHVNNCSYYCHQASGVGLSSSLGTGTATLKLDDLGESDTFFLFGGNPASNHPRLMTELMHLRRRGGRVVVVNPVKETGLVEFRVPSDVRSFLFGTKIATHYAQIHIGGDIAFCIGMAKALLEMEATLTRSGTEKSQAGKVVDHDFIAAATEDWDKTRALLEQTPWNDIERQSGLPRHEIEQLAEVYARSQRSVFAWTMGITHHEHGVANVHWLVNLALMRGMVGRPGTGLLPIRGHSNVQGMGSVAVTPALKDAVLQRFRENGIALPTHQGLDTMGCMDAAFEGRMRLGFALGGNLYGSNPDASYAAEALAKLDMLVYLNTSLNTGHAHGLAKETLILPVLARDEEPYTTTQESMFSYVRLSDGGRSRFAHAAGGGPRGEVEIVSEFGARLLGDHGAVAWSKMRNTNEIRRWIAQLIPGLEKIQHIGQSKQEFSIPGRTFHERRFPTESGRARFFADALPSLATSFVSDIEAAEGRGDDAVLKLMTVRSEGQFNTVVYEDDDYYRGQERRDVILLHPDDMRCLGLSENDRVTVRSGTGAMGGIYVRPFDIRPGNALMYYPEANVLVPRQLDPQSLTPSFKNVAIVLSRETSIQIQTGTGSQGRGFFADVRQALKRRMRPSLKSC